jgi:hypothetical protein
MKPASFTVEETDNVEDGPSKDRCSMCGSSDIEAVVLELYGIETNCNHCLDCDHIFGGDL